MKKILLVCSMVVMIFLAKSTLAQQQPDTPIVHDLTPKIYKNFPVTGRVIGVNLEFVAGAAITDIRTAETATTDSKGIFHLTAAKGDTLNIISSRYSKDIDIVRSPKENQNIILIKRKVDELPKDASPGDIRKAARADEELIRILEKDAKLEDKWKY